MRTRAEVGKEGAKVSWIIMWLFYWCIKPETSKTNVTKAFPWQCKSTNISQVSRVFHGNFWQPDHYWAVQIHESFLLYGIYHSMLWTTNANKFCRMVSCIHGHNSYVSSYNDVILLWNIPLHSSAIITMANGIPNTDRIRRAMMVTNSHVKNYGK